MRHGGTFPRFLSGICTICAGISEDGGLSVFGKAAGICKVVRAVACRMEKSRNLQNGKGCSVAYGKKQESAKW